MPPNQFSEEKRKAIGRRLRTLRKQRNLTAVRLAAAADIKSPSHYSCIERGEHSASAATLGRLAKALDVSAKYLETGRNGKNGANGEAAS